MNNSLRNFIVETLRKLLPDYHEEAKQMQDTDTKVFCEMTVGDVRRVQKALALIDTDTATRADPRAIANRDDMNSLPYRFIDYHNNFIAYPEDWPKYFNGMSAEPCIFLQGPCVCGAWHNLSEWALRPSAAQDTPIATEAVASTPVADVAYRKKVNTTYDFTVLGVNDLTVTITDWGSDFVCLTMRGPFQYSNSICGMLHLDRSTGKFAWRYGQSDFWDAYDTRVLDAICQYVNEHGIPKPETCAEFSNVSTSMGSFTVGIVKVNIVSQFGSDFFLEVRDDEGKVEHGVLHLVVEDADDAFVWGFGRIKLCDKFGVPVIDDILQYVNTVGISKILKPT